MSIDPGTSGHPLTAGPVSTTLVEVGRLYVLTRDAYLSTPALTLAKLASLTELRADVARHLADSGTANELDRLSGVRLVEALRRTLRRLSQSLTRHERLLVLVDILTTSGPSTGSGWAGSPTGPGLDLAAQIVPELAPARLEALLRRRRSLLRSLRSGSARPGVRESGGEAAWLADTLAEVLGLDTSAAAVAALRALSGDETTTTPIRRGFAGGELFDRLEGVPAGGPRVFVGGALADAFPQAFIHHLATVEVVAHLREDLRDPLTGRLALLRSDLLSDPDRPVPDSVRALDIVSGRIARRRLLGYRLHGRLTRHGLARP